MILLFIYFIILYNFNIHVHTFNIYIVCVCVLYICFIYIIYSTGQNLNIASFIENHYFNEQKHVNIINLYLVFML